MQRAPEGSGLGTHSPPPPHSGGVTVGGRPQSSALICQAAGGIVVPPSGAQLPPDGAPPSSVNRPPPPQLKPKFGRVHVVPMGWNGCEQLAVQVESLQRSTTGGLQLAPATAPHAHVHCASPASRPSRPLSISAE